MYDLDVKPEVDKIFKKLSRVNKERLRKISKKIKEIRTKPDRSYKFLKKPLQTYNRVHIDTHFVLVFKINHTKKIVEIYYFDHHDNVYAWRPKI